MFLLPMAWHLGPWWAVSRWSAWPLVADHLLDAKRHRDPIPVAPCLATPGHPLATPWPPLGVDGKPLALEWIKHPGHPGHP